jgi:hypothetical protein
MPRLPLLLRLAEVLGIDDLAELTGESRLSTATYTKTAHEQLPAVANALAHYSVSTEQSTPDIPGLTARVAQLWELWHGARRHRTAIAGLLPTILKDARITVRLSEGADRRMALVAEAQVYHLAQLYLSFQPAPELVALTSDRAMLASQDADSPLAMAAAAWYANHRFRDAGEQHDARVELAMDTARLLNPEGSADDRALWGLLHLALALSYAKVGREGDAWRHWDRADTAVKALGESYLHPWLMFGRGMVDSYALTMLADLTHGADAIWRADRVDLGATPSATRQSFHTIELARSYHQRREYVACVALLNQAFEISPDTSRFNNFTRAAVLELSEHGGSTVRYQAAGLAQRLDLLG